MAARGRGIFSLYIYIKKIKKNSCQKPLDRLRYNLVEIFLWWSFTKVVQAIWIRQKTWPPEGGGGVLFSLHIYIENFKNLLVRNHWTDFHIILQKFPLVILYQDCSSHFDSSKNMAARGPGLFSLYIYIENLKILLVRSYWTNCNIIWQKCSFGDPLLRLFKPFGFVKKHGRHGAGLIFPIYLYKKLENSSCQNPLERFHYNLAKMFPWWPSNMIVQIIVILQKTWPLGVGPYFPCISN